MSEIDAIALSKTVAHALQAAAIQCTNPAATQCRETNAEGKNSNIQLHAAAGPDNVYKENMVVLEVWAKTVQV